MIVDKAWHSKKKLDTDHKTSEKGDNNKVFKMTFSTFRGFLKTLHDYVSKNYDIFYIAGNKITDLDKSS